MRYCWHTVGYVPALMKAHARGFETVSLLPVIFFFPFLFYDKNLEAYMSAVHGCRIALLSYSFLFFSDRKTASHRTWTWAPYIHERRIALFFKVAHDKEAAYALFSCILCRAVTQRYTRCIAFVYSMLLTTHLAAEFCLPALPHALCQQISRNRRCVARESSTGGLLKKKSYFLRCETDN